MIAVHVYPIEIAIRKSYEDIFRLSSVNVDNFMSDVPAKTIYNRAINGVHFLLTFAANATVEGAGKLWSISIGPGINQVQFRGLYYVQNFLREIALPDADLSAY